MPRMLGLHKYSEEKMKEKTILDSEQMDMISGGIIAKPQNNGADGRTASNPVSANGITTGKNHPGGNIANPGSNDPSVDDQ